MTRSAMAAALAAMLGTGAGAGELTFGLGAMDYHFGGPNGVQIDIEARTDPFARIGPNGIAWTAAITANDTGSWWTGAGLAATAAIRGPWFVQSSLMGGYYDAGSYDSQLGSDFEFRVASALGRELADGRAVSLGWVHISNGGTGTFNSGVDALSLRLTTPF